MKHHPAWLAAGLLLSVLLACNLSKNANNSNANRNSNNRNSSNTTAEEDLGSGNAIEEIHMAKDDGDGQPGAESETFEPGDRTVHCVTKLKAAKSGTQMRFVWWIVDADNTQNQKIKEIEYRTRALENIVHGHLTVPQDWPAGKYKVQVYVNGDLDKTAFYTVR
jgi:hypothetical protein